MLHNFIQLDKSLTLGVNQLGGRWNVVDALGVFASEYLIFIMALAAFAWAWYTFRASGFGTVAIASVASQIFKKVISLFYFRERPGIAHLFNELPYSASFPSGHSSGAFALAFAVLLLSNWKSKLGWTLLALACFVALGRVFEGFHYVSDVIAGVFFGFCSAWIGVKLRAVGMRTWKKEERT